MERGACTLWECATRHAPATGRRHLPDGVTSNAFSLSKLSRDRPYGVHPDLVRVVERAILITPQDFRVQEGLRTRERHAGLVARGASRTMNSALGPTATRPLSGQEGYKVVGAVGAVARWQAT